MKLKNTLKILSIIIILLIPQLILAFPIDLNSQWDYHMIKKFERNLDLFDNFNATKGFRARQSAYLNISRFNEGFYAQSARIYLGEEVYEDSLKDSLYKIINYEDCMDFQMSGFLRMLYLNLETDVLSNDIKDMVIDALGKGKYWYTEPTRCNAIFYTENHQILYHSAELLVGQLFPNDTFTNSGMTGKEHMENALPLIERWLDWRGQLGFTEWHSNTYLVEDIAALMNIIDFCKEANLVYKAAMIMDIIAFDFANNFYKNRFATSMGRCYDSTRVLTSRDSISEAAWLMLGLGSHNPCDASNMAAVALATSPNYAPPPILEEIAENASEYFEHWERNSIYLEEGPKYNIDYEGDELMYWWSMAAPLAPHTIEGTIKLIEKYNLEPWTISGPQELIDFLKISSFLHGMTLSEYSETGKLLTRGSCYETANIYTYRTPYYQLSGAQDHMKGMNGMQEHIWQASLDDEAYVFTNSPGGLSKDFDQLWMGGWKPRATIYKNIGVIQYDRETLPLEFEFAISLITTFTKNKRINHAYFPKTSFDEVQDHGNWVFGKKNDGYVALYSYKTAFWASDYELCVNGYKNVWIVELGSKEDYISFDDFVEKILDAQIKIKPQTIGYEISYKSPSRGKVTVSWDGPFNVDGKKINIGDYPRYNNQYCYQEFGSKQTVIEHNNQRLELNFENATRLYQDYR
ncbi:MAG: hypothetical protein ACTSR8_08185 [Promethearchaeota archaeon]